MTFRSWLVAQANAGRRDPVGHLAGDVLADVQDGCLQATSPNGIREHMRDQHGPGEGALDAFDAAVAEYRAGVGPMELTLRIPAGPALLQWPLSERVLEGRLPGRLRVVPTEDGRGWDVALVIDGGYTSQDHAWGELAAWWHEIGKALVVAQGLDFEEKPVMPTGKEEP